MEKFTGRVPVLIADAFWYNYGEAKKGLVKGLLGGS